MKLTLNYSELAELSSVKETVRNHFTLPSWAQVEVVPDSPPTVQMNMGQVKVFAGIAQAINQHRGPFYYNFNDPLNKIAAIKEMRTVVSGMGLAEAKKLVEDYIEMLRN